MSEIAKTGSNRAQATASLLRWIERAADRHAKSSRSIIEALDRRGEAISRDEKMHLQHRLAQIRMEQFRLKNGMANSPVLATLHGTERAAGRARAAGKLPPSRMNPDGSVQLRRVAKPKRPAEIRASGCGRCLVGSAIVYNTDSVNMGGWIEQIRPGAFTEVLRTSDARCLFNHDGNMILGRQSAGTLTLHDRATSLDFTCRLPENETARRIDEAISRRDVQGCSFCFVVDREGDEWTLAQKPGEPDRRYITKAKELLDVGPVTYPAYPETVVAAMEAGPGRAYIDAVCRERLANLKAKMAAW